MTAGRLTLVAAMALLCGGARAADPAPVKVYVPRSITVSGETLRMGDLCAIVSADEPAAAAARAVAMGRAPWSKERITVPRHAILSRLAAAGIPASRVRFSGAAEVLVQRNERIIGSEELTAAAEAFLGRTHPLPPAQAYRPEGRPAELVLPSDRGDVRLVPRLSPRPSKDSLLVEVVAQAADGAVLGVGQIAFRIAYQRRQAVATQDLPAGATITPANARVEAVEDDRPGAADWEPPFGQVLVAPVSAGKVIPPALLKKVQAPLAVRRHQRVVMKLQGEGFTLSALGQALQDGRPGDAISVQNVDTKRVLTVRVNADGTVSPVLEEPS